MTAAAAWQQQQQQSRPLLPLRLHRRLFFVLVLFASVILFLFLIVLRDVSAAAFLGAAPRLRGGNPHPPAARPPLDEDLEVWATASLLDGDESVEGWSADWFRASPVLHTLDHVETQLFALDPPVDATAIRIVSLTNAERAQRDAAGDGAAPRQEAFPHLLSGLSAYVGLFQVAFA